MVLLLIIAAWLTLSTFVYAFTVRYFLAHVQSVPVHIVAGVLFSAVLSPGGAVEHGVAPFPGGLMCIRLLLTDTPYWRGNLFNLFFWALTAAIFISVTLTLRQQK